jgi:hypothetical protein|tara:strand:- start:26 stop:430 length:405 start_codon:yes stop_codon:yes gene_type:complete
MKNIEEEIKRIRQLLNLGEHIQHNNFAQMGISRKTISRGGVIHQEQEAPPSKLETPRDIEIQGKIEINKEKEDIRKKEVEDTKKEKESQEIELQGDEVTKGQEDTEKEVEKEKEEIKKKDDLEKTLTRQRNQKT